MALPVIDHREPLTKALSSPGRDGSVLTQIKLRRQQRYRVMMKKYRALVGGAGSV